MSRKRVVLLARPGAARERTQAAAAAVDAEIVGVLDPSSSGEDDVRALAPDVLLVILDPALEQALPRFDGVLGDPAIEVMFEDADVAARREGWEAARWARHLEAKLHGHDNVLPRAKNSVARQDAQDTGRDEDLRFREELTDLQLQVAQMPELPQDRIPGGSQLGAVAVCAGIGGPDAVRQLLAGLPADFPRAVLLRQRIEGGHYDKLVRQMQRATAMPVGLVQAGDPVRAGHVHVMPDGIDVVSAPAGLVFAMTDGAPVFAPLQNADSALLLLSGADTALVGRALSLALVGGVALGQSAENSFDPTASNELVARGGEAVAIARLPRILLERWPA